MGFSEWWAWRKAAVAVSMKVSSRAKRGCSGRGPTVAAP